MAANHTEYNGEPMPKKLRIRSLEEAIKLLTNDETFVTGPGFNNVIMDSQSELRWDEPQKRIITATDIRLYGHITGYIKKLVYYHIFENYQQALQAYSEGHGCSSIFTEGFEQGFNSGEQNGSTKMFFAMKKELIEAFQECHAQDFVFKKFNTIWEKLDPTKEEE